VAHAPAPLSVEAAVVTCGVLLLDLVLGILVERVHAHASTFDCSAANVEARGRTHAQRDAAFDIARSTVQRGGGVRVQEATDLVRVLHVAEIDSPAVVEPLPRPGSLHRWQVHALASSRKRL